jgi:putative membrane protein
MKNFIINALSLYVISQLFSSVQISSLQALLMLTLIFAILNATIKPILQFLSFPITFSTLGFFSLIINGIVLRWAFNFVSGAHLGGGLGTSVVIVLALSFFNSILEDIFKKD